MDHTFVDENLIDDKKYLIQFLMFTCGPIFALLLAVFVLYLFHRGPKWKPYDGPTVSKRCKHLTIRAETINEVMSH